LSLKIFESLFLDFESSAMVVLLCAASKLKNLSKESLVDHDSCKEGEEVGW